ncbi:MAG: GTPase [Bryobacteraceae bacterium]
MIRLAAIGTASTGKSAVLNALFGTRFHVDPRARSTEALHRAVVRLGGREIEVIDTAPLSIAAEERVEADVYLLVCDKDLTAIDYRNAVRLAHERRPVAVAMNKADTFSDSQLRDLVMHVRERLQEILPPQRVVACAADPVRMSYQQQNDGTRVEQFTRIAPDVTLLQTVVLEMIEEAEDTLRVRVREFAARAADKVSSFWNGRFGS